jgi:hypothetical protein
MMVREGTEPQPYSEDWLRARGAAYNPLNGEKLPQPESTKAEKKEAEKKEAEKKEAEENDKKSLRLPLIFGGLLAIAAVILSEHYMVPLLSSPAVTTGLKKQEKKKEQKNKSR